MLTELDVINACLATMSEMPLVELDDDHPLVASARQNFKEALVKEMGLKWWFNTDFLSLKQANDKFIYVPQDAVSCVPLYRDDLTMRGRRLYDRYNGTYEITGPIDVYVIRNIPFEELPLPAQILVRDRTVLDFQMNYDGDELRTRKLEEAYARSYRQVNAENTRQLNINVFRMQETMRARHRAGYRTSRVGRNFGGLR